MRTAPISQRRYAEIGVADLAPYGFPEHIVEMYCAWRRIAATGLRQNHFGAVMSGRPMFERVSAAEREKFAKFADDFLTRVENAPKFAITAPSVQQTIH